MDTKELKGLGWRMGGGGEHDRAEKHKNDKVNFSELKGRSYLL